MRALFLFLFYSLLLSCSPTARYYEKRVKFPSGATLEEKVDIASRVVPTPRQKAWQELELTAFLHFGMNTFTNEEWGNGQEDPNLFNPTHFDARQWVKALKDGGFKMCIITAKHHDGFCLWPTRTTNHSVAFSDWMDGKGDVVKAVREACDEYGLKFGIYLSPWDRNAISYGDSPAYNQLFVDQLTELLTNYGIIHEVWFDGACGEGPNGKKQEYDWIRFHEVIRRLQPEAVTAIMGDDVRWVGNEKGYGRATEWSATVKAPGWYDTTQNSDLQLSSSSEDLGSRRMLEKATELFWYPSEVDVSIRPGWFYHPEQDNQVKSLAKLVDIYFESVGYNSVLLLNVPPDKRGLIHENDVARLKEFGDYIRTSFSRNFITDTTQWKASEGASKIFQLDSPALINTLMFQEDISYGQRMEHFKVEALIGNSWKEVAEATTIGYKRLIRIPAIEASAIRITVVQSRGEVNFRNIGAYYAEPVVESSGALIFNEISSEKWDVVNLPADARKAIDGNLTTSWTTDSFTSLTVDMRETHEIGGFTYTPPSGEDISGTIYTYNFYISNNGRDWTTCVGNGEFSNIMHNPITQFIRFDTTHNARFFRLELISEIEGRQMMSVGEVGVLK